MKTRNIKKGFTLIELMVVIAIIMFLSSVVLASVQQVRQRARVKAYRASVMQTINAIELYRNEQGYYPGEAELQSTGNEAYYHVYDAGGNSFIQELYPSGFDFPTVMKKYIPKISNPTEPGAEFFYYRNTYGYKCWGDVRMPAYIIFISILQPGFEDWKDADFGYQETYYKCFSLQ